MSNGSLKKLYYGNEINMAEEDPLAKKRRLNTERQQKWRARQSEEKRIELRKVDAVRKTLRIQNESEEQATARRAAQVQSQRLSLRNQTPEEAEVRRIVHAQSERTRLLYQTPEEAEARRAANAVAHRLAQEHRSQAIRDQAFHFDENQVSQFNCGSMNVLCQFCGSRNFAAERPSDGKFNSCCRKGKVKLEKPLDATGNALQYPDFLRKMLSSPDHPSYRHFRENIRSYNSAVSCSRTDGGKGG